MRRTEHLLPTNLVKKANEINKQQKILEKALPQPEFSSIQVGGVTGKALTLFAANAAIGSNLRFYQNQIIAAFNRDTAYSVSSVNIRIAKSQHVNDNVPNTENPAQPPRKELSAARLRLRNLLKQL